MIRINLITTGKAKRVKKRTELQTQLILAGISMGLTVILCGYFWWQLNNQISVLVSDRAKATKERDVLKEKVKEVDNFEENKRVLEEKNRIIGQLKRNQSGPVHLLDELSKNLPDRVWLVSMSEQEGKIDLEGRAITNSDIVDFINNLKRSSFFKDIQIVESRQTSDNEKKISLYNFKLTFIIIL
ncbi:MAG TPA: PilN domain-containing protein [Candidatus Hodarchaeales archaeon]|nr:PilN domain-containing protein [Candidatus Hodarchaeales archaeon]